MRSRRGDLPVDVPPDTVPAVDAFRRDIVAAATDAEVVDALLRLVVALGGQIVRARTVDPHVLPIDLSLGVSTPLLAEAEAASVARLALEQVLPGAVEVAAEAVGALWAEERRDEGTAGPAGMER
jgi:hypothetical protein